MNLLEYIEQELPQEEQIFSKTLFDKFNTLSKVYENNLPFDGTLKGKGQFNSKICLCFLDQNHFESLKDNIQKVFDIYGIKLYDVFVLFLNKYEDNNLNIQIMLDELNAITPMILYCFDMPEDISDQFKNKLSIKYFNIINLQNFLCMKTSPEIFDCFKYLITYNY